MVQGVRRLLQGAPWHSCSPGGQNFGAFWEQCIQWGGKMCGWSIAGVCAGGWIPWQLL